MISSIFELFVTFGLGIIVSGFAFLWARRSLIINDDIVLPKEDFKIKTKFSKQPVKNKTVKKDVSNNKQKNNTKAEQKSILNVVKNHETLKEVTESIAAVAVERNRNDSTAEWTKVIKPTKKAKKEIKTDLDNLSTSDDSVKMFVKENSVKESVKSNVSVVKETMNNKFNLESQNKTNLTKELKSEKIIVKPIEQGKNVKLKKFVTIDDEIANKETKVKPHIDEIKSKMIENEDDEMKQKISEMTELDKIKNNRKDESKSTNQINKDVESLKFKLQTSQNNEQKLLEDVRKKGQAVTDLKNQFLIIQSELTKNIVSNQSVNREKLNLENRLRSLEEQNAKMNEKCQLFEQLKIENEGLEKNFIAVEQELKNVKLEYTEKMKSRELDMLTQINLLQTEKHQMRDQLVRVQTDLIDNNNKMQTIQQDLLTEKSTHANLLSANMQLQKQYTDLEQSTLLNKQELIDLDNKIKQNEEQIACLKKQINDLNTMNINLSVQKSDLEKQIDQLRNSQLTINNLEVNELSEKVKLLTQQVVDTKADLATSQTKLEDYSTICAQHLIQLKELIMERDNLLALVDQYKTGLESTESILSKLQASVNEEESKWRESLLKSETEAEKSKKELEIVYNDLMRIRNSRAEKNELNFAYHCVDKSLSSLIDEMEARMIHFEKSFETVVQERDIALSQISTQINGVTSNHEIVNGDQSIHSDDSEIDKLKIDLEHQMDINKSLENHCNKYQTLIDIDKDALETEKIHVQEVQDELKSQQTLSSNVFTNNVEISFDAK